MDSNAAGVPPGPPKPQGNKKAPPPKPPVDLNVAPVMKGSAAAAAKKPTGTSLAVPVPKGARKAKGTSLSIGGPGQAGLNAQPIAPVVKADSEAAPDYSLIRYAEKNFNEHLEFVPSSTMSTFSKKKPARTLEWREMLFYTKHPISNSLTVIKSEGLANLACECHKML